MMQSIGKVLPIMVAGVFLAACNMAKPATTTTPTEVETETGAAETDSMMAEPTSALAEEGMPEGLDMTVDENVRVIEVEAGSFYYKPDVIRVKKGETVKIVMNSVDMMHDFNVEELDLVIPITKSGETNEVIFTAETAGEFEYYCSVGQHRANGQVGTLIVEE